MKENSIEEDIKIINNFITYFNKNIQNGNKADLTVLGEEINALEHILSDYKRVLKENKELEEWNEYYRKEMLSKEYIKLNYIPKSKVEEKIGELNKQLEEDLQDEIKVNSNRFIIICQCKSCLQELLESEE